MSYPLNTKENVYDYMEKNMVEFEFRETTQEFLPKSVLVHVTERDVIRTIIKGDMDLNDDDLNELVETVLVTGRKMFATCVYSMINMKYLRIMLQNGLTDGRLPLKGREDFGSLSEKRQLTRLFIDNQSRFNTIHFHEDSFQKFGCKSNLFTIPIHLEENETNLKGKGAFGAVYMCKIHRDHRSFACETNANDMFALKITEHEKVLDREQAYHQAMVGLKHPHLVKCLASFKLGQKYHMVYDLADCDLESFTQKYPVATQAPGVTASWLSQQLAGLADALRLVHNPDGSSVSDTSKLSVPKENKEKTGYIHDIKPENILLFKNKRNVYYLRLSDFSCAKVAEALAIISGKRKSYETENKIGTPVYRAPESLKGKTSRPYDIWSLGCVYLELLVWFFEGWDNLVAFRDSREGPVRPREEFTDEGFFHVTDAGTIQLRPAVVQKIQRLRELSQHCEGSLKGIIDIIPSLLQIETTRRPTASELVEKLKKLGISVSTKNSVDQSDPVSMDIFESPPAVVDDSSDSEYGGVVKVKVIRPSI